MLLNAEKKQQASGIPCGGHLSQKKESIFYFTLIKSLID